MCRPRLPNALASGWHLHQTLCDRRGGANVFVPAEDGQFLSPVGCAFLGGLIEHARAAAAFTTPTINGYKRYRPHALAPDRAIWGHDNRGVMVRALGGPGDAATRLENRVGEPAANSLSLHGLADRRRARRPPAQARSGPVRGYAL